jgi:hypothetical protein
MVNFVDFINNLRVRFKKDNFYILDLPPAVLGHLVDLRTSKESLFIQFEDKAIMIYENENRCVVLGSILTASKRNFKQLLVLNFNQSLNQILDNTNNVIKEEDIIQTLINWLKK